MSNNLWIATCSTKTFTSGNSSKIFLKLAAGRTNKSQTEAAFALVILLALANKHISEMKFVIKLKERGNLLSYIKDFYRHDFIQIGV